MQLRTYVWGWIGICAGLLLLWGTTLVFFTRQWHRLQEKNFENASYKDVGMEYGVGSPSTEKFAYMFGVGGYTFFISMIVTLFVYEGSQRKKLIALAVGVMSMLVSTFVMRAWGPIVLRQGRSLGTVYWISTLLNIAGLFAAVIAIGCLDVFGGIKPVQRTVVKSLLCGAFGAGGLFLPSGVGAVCCGGSFVVGIAFLISSLVLAVMGVLLGFYWEYRKPAASVPTEESAQPLIEPVVA